jgi:hypothetical protein
MVIPLSHLSLLRNFSLIDIAKAIDIVIEEGNPLSDHMLDSMVELDKDRYENFMKFDKIQ